MRRAHRAVVDDPAALARPVFHRDQPLPQMAGSLFGDRHAVEAFHAVVPAWGPYSDLIGQNEIIHLRPALLAFPRVIHFSPARTNPARVKKPTSIPT